MEGNLNKLSFKQKFPFLSNMIDSNLILLYLIGLIFLIYSSNLFLVSGFLPEDTFECAVYNLVDSKDCHYKQLYDSHNSIMNRAKFFAYAVSYVAFPVLNLGNLFFYVLFKRKLFKE